MNIHKPVSEHEPDMAQAEAALDVLRAFVTRASDEQIASLDPSVRRLLPGLPDPAYPQFSRTYPADFTPDTAYKRTMPDLQNGPASLIKGANRTIQHVGISNFRLPVRFRTRQADQDDGTEAAQ